MKKQYNSLFCGGKSPINSFQFYYNFGIPTVQNIPEIIRLPVYIPEEWRMAIFGEKFKTEDLKILLSRGGLNGTAYHNEINMTKITQFWKTHSQ